MTSPCYRILFSSLIAILSLLIRFGTTSTAKKSISRLMMLDSRRRTKCEKHDLIPDDLCILILDFLPSCIWDLTDSEQLIGCMQAIGRNHFEYFRLIIGSNSSSTTTDNKRFVLDGRFANSTVKTERVFPHRIISGQCKVCHESHTRSAAPVRGLGADGGMMRLIVIESNVESDFELLVTSKMGIMNVWTMIRISFSLARGLMRRHYDPYGLMKGVEMESVQLQALNHTD